MIAQAKDVPLITEVVGVTDPFLAIDFVKAEFVDVAFLDIEMPKMKGLELAECLKTIQPSIAIVFVTKHMLFAVDAFRIRADGFLLKPAFATDLQTELENILKCREKSTSNRIFIKTFGNFDVFVDEQLLTFRRSKAKELLAYLVDRNGSFVTNGQAMAVLWEERFQDKTLNSMYRTVLSDLIATLREVQADQILVKRRNNVAINKNKFNCDYYQYLEGNHAALRTFSGEYMLNYSWAEYTVGILSNSNPEKTNINYDLSGS